jgi:8-hydroxy-5-deazaflavin:NADPH oxidoreductase
MNIGVIGTGQIGEVIIRKLRGAGYSVKMANSRGPDSLRVLAAATGATPVSLEHVVREFDVLFLVVPQKAIPKGLLRNAKQDTIVIDVGNYYEYRDGHIDEIEDGLTDSEWVERQIDWPVVKVLNSVIRKSLAEAGRPAGSIGRVAFPISGDNTRSKEIVAQLLDRLGFDSVDAGTIAESWRQQPGSPAYCTNPTRSELELWLKKVDRSSLADNKKEGSAAYYSNVDADYQTQANAYRAIFR